MKTPSDRQLLEAMESAARLRNKLLADELRPRYHFATPGDYGFPGDPNMAFYANGRYHLMYLYKNLSDYYRLGHLSSVDLLHWRQHPDALGPDGLDGGIFSGGAFVDEDKTAYLAYWALPKEGCTTDDRHGGIRLARSTDVRNHYETWEKFPELAVRATREPAATEVTDESGNVIDYLGCADPSNLWKVGDTYYMQLGTLVVLNKFRDDPAAPARLRGDWTELYASPDLRHWTHRGRFYRRDPSGRWTDGSEDDMCPSFLPLPKDPDGAGISGKYLQLFLAHNRGAQYYIGSYDPEKGKYPFTPESHGRMSWNDLSFFAPEALVDDRGRQIMWAWLHDDLCEGDPEALARGYCGVFSLPRTLWYNERGGLGIAPVAELRRLRYHETEDLNAVNARSCEVLLHAEVGADSKTGLRISLSEREYVDVYYDARRKLLVYDAQNALRSYAAKAVEEAPLALDAGEALCLDVFVDRSVIEVFANDRQAVCRRSYAKGAYAPSVALLAERTGRTKVTAWEIDETNLF